MNLSSILEAIKTTENVKVLVKSLTDLEALLKFKVHYDEIIKSNVLYTTAHTILSQGLDDNSMRMRVLCFLRTMLRARPRDEGSEGACGPVALARDRIRRSGCLQDMANMFLGTMMMYEETWKTLCECLIESCRDCEDNQSYCARLIPTGIQRCDARNTEILKLLHTLILNHTSNVHLFIECNGLSIFTRETIRDRSRMELLSILVQDSTAAGLLKHDTDLLEYLCMGDHFQDSFKMTEWASVILFHIASHIEGGSKSGNSKESMLKTMDLAVTDSTDESFTDFSVSFLIKSNWDTNIHNNIKTGKDHNLENARIYTKTQRFTGTGHNQISLRSSVIDTIDDNFIPNYVSTPNKKLKMIKERQDVKLKHNFAEKRNYAFRRRSQGNNSAPLTKQKLSMTARLYNIVNNSCASIYQTVGNLLSDLSRPFIKDEKADKKPQHFHENLKNKDLENCHLRELGINQKYLNNIVKKLKTGIHFYGCNFKKISRVMWPHEKHMTPRVLYGIYRKCIVK